MKVLFMSTGSRGDVEPFLVQAEMFAHKNWDVVCVFPEQFRILVEELGYTFFGLNPEFLELISGTHGRAFAGGTGNWFKRAKTFLALAKQGLRVSKLIAQDEVTIINSQEPDLVVYHPKSMYPLVWELANPGRAMMICPVPCMIHINEDHSAIGLRGGGDYGRTINRLSYRLTEIARALAVHSYTRKIATDANGKKLRLREVLRTIRQRERTMFSLSPTLYPQPGFWPTRAHVAGYFERQAHSNWAPDEALTNFITQHKKVVFISFGSIANPYPDKHTTLIMAALQKHGLAGVINTSWGGLEKPKEPISNVLFVSDIPYNWILPKVYAVIHHGGSGTTQAGLKHGCATMIIPHMIDQFYWNERMEELGVGPKGPSIQKLNTANFEAGLLGLMTNYAYKKKAGNISEAMSNEADPERAFSLLTERIEDKSRTDVGKL